MRKTLVATAALTAMLFGSASTASPKPCRDSSGKILVCPKPRKTMIRCKDDKGRFVDCTTPGAKPAAEKK